MGGTGSIFNFTAQPSPTPTTTPPPQQHGGSIFDFSGHAAPAAPGKSIFNFASSPPEEGGIMGAVRMVGSGLSNALNAQHDTMAEHLFHKGSPDANREAQRKAWGLKAGYDDPRLFGGGPGTPGIPVPGWVTHAVRGVEDAALDTAIDPLTAETLGVGALAKTTAKVAGTGLKALQATPLGAVVHDFLRWGGPVARTHGEEAIQKVRGASNYASAMNRTTQQHLIGQFHKITSGLNDEDKVAVAKALNGETPVHELAPHQTTAYNGLRHLTEQDYKLRTDVARKVAFNQVAFALQPQERAVLAQAFVRGAAPQEPRLAEAYNLINQRAADAIPKREDYMPWTHEAAEIDEGGSKARTVNVLDRPDLRAIPRPDMTVTHAGQLGAGFEAMASNAGRQVERGVLHDALGELVDDPQVHKLFDQTIKATGSQRTDIERVKDGWLAAIGYPRAATVSMTPRHAVNILDLLANTVGPTEAPNVLRETMRVAAKLVAAKTPEEAAELTKEGRELGALSGEFTERKPFFQEFPKWVPGVGGKGTGPLGAWTRLNNRLVWAVDEAAKQTYAKLIVSRGEAEGLQAGGLASARLVDYAHHSPLVNALKYVAPFGTFRGSVPGAVLGGVARNPMRAALYNRLSGGTMYGNKPQGPHGVTDYSPTADVGRGVGAPQEFLRSTLGTPVQGAGVLGAEVVTGYPGASLQTAAQEVRDVPRAVARSIADRRIEFPQARKETPYARASALHAARYLNYRNPIDLRWLLSASAAGVIEARDALTEMGLGQFKAHPGSALQKAGEQAAQQSLGIGIR